MKQEPKKEWVIGEVHGIWWAWLEPKPPDEAFRTHGRPTKPRIIGPFHNKIYAEVMAAKTAIY